MYTIYADGSPVYAPSMDDDGYVVIDPNLTLEANKSGTMVFTVPTTNLMYNEFQKLKTHISVYQDGKMIWYGRVFETQRDFYNRKKVTCEGSLAFLSDTIIRPFEKLSMTISGFLSEMISQHNSQASEENQLTLGKVSISQYTGNQSFENDQYESAWDVIQNGLVDAFGGYLLTRESGGKHYIDYVDDDWLLENRKNAQTIEFGENLLDLTEYISAEDVITVLIPLGDVITGSSTSSDDTEVTSFVYTDANRVNIKTVNDNKDYIENSDGIALFGKIWGSKQYDGITEPSELLKTAKADLSTIVQQTKTMDISAIDLLDAGVDTTRLQFGYMTNVISVPHSVNDWFLLSKITLYLAQPDKSKYTLGQSSTTLTDAMAKTSISAKASAGAIKTIKASAGQALGTATAAYNLANQNNSSSTTT